MSTNAHTADNGTDDRLPADDMADGLADAIADSFTVGTDAKCYDHHFYARADVVVVYDETGVDFWQYLDGASLAKWVRYVRDRRGWQSMGPFATLGIDKDEQRKGVSR